MSCVEYRKKLLLWLMPRYKIKIKIKNIKQKPIPPTSPYRIKLPIHIIKSTEFNNKQIGKYGRYKIQDVSPKINNHTQLFRNPNCLILYKKN